MLQLNGQGRLDASGQIERPTAPTKTYYFSTTWNSRQPLAIDNWQMIAATIFSSQ